MRREKGFSFSSVALVTLQTLLLIILTKLIKMVRLYYLDAKSIFSKHFHQFFNVGGMSQNVLYAGLTEHDTCSDLLLSSLQNVSLFLYSNVSKSI